MKALGIVALVAAGVLAGCDESGPSYVGQKVAALDDALWAQSEWISVKEAKVFKGPVGVNSRAEEGTSWFATQITNAKAVKKATWMTTGLGVYEAYVNGQKVGREFLKPGFTHPRKTRRSFTYDITDAIKTGTDDTNVFSAEVSAGWWRDKVVSPAFQPTFIGKKSAFRAVLKLDYADGTSQIFGTDAKTWKSDVGGAVKTAAIFDGEIYDARIAQPWCPSMLKGTTEVNDEFKGEILPSEGAEVYMRWDLAMKKGAYALKKGEKLTLDFGQNCAGVPAFRFAAKRGTVLTVLPAEMLNDADKGERGCDGPKGTIYRANLRCPDTGMYVKYTFAGKDEEIYWPRFTFFGYRYIEVSATDDVEIREVASIPVTSVSKEMEIGTIKTGDPSLNRFIANVYWGMLSNYLSIPTDCPQRNERLGWTADTQVFADAGAYIADTRRFFAKWMRDERDTQAPTGGLPGVAPYAQYGSDSNLMMRTGWADAGIIVPWKIWRQFGDTQIINENWAMMEKFIDHVNETKYDHATNAKETNDFQWNDWLSLDKFESASSNLNPEYDAYYVKDGKRVRREGVVDYWSLIGAYHWIQGAQMMRDMAAATGRDTAKWVAMETAAKAYTKAKFFNTPDGCVRKPFDDMQTPAVFAIKLGLVEGAAKGKTIAFLRRDLEKRGNVTGFLGSSWLMDVLADNGMGDIAVNRILSHEFPSWLYSVDQGATTIWERWNGWTKERGFGSMSMNSYNHYAYGAVLAWMYRHLAGIAPDLANPGFKNIIMKPIADKRLGEVRAEYKSAAGLIKSAWHYEGDTFVWQFTIPQGATAQVTLPGENASTRYTAGTYTLKK